MNKMVIKPPAGCPFHAGLSASSRVDPDGAPAPSREVHDATEIDRRAPAPPTQRPPVPAPPVTIPRSTWPSSRDIGAVLAHAVTDVPDESLSGEAATAFDATTLHEIHTFQERLAKSEHSETMARLVHRQQLHGGAVQVLWNPDMSKLLNLFDQSTSNGLIRISDAASQQNPDGASMYGMALELIGRDGQATDILMTGGSPLTERSQAKDATAQLDLFNMINPPCKLEGLAKIVWDVGPVSGPRMLLDVLHMRTKLDSVAHLTAWSRAPFSVDGKDGKQYLVKMRAVPLDAQPPLPTPPEDHTSSEKLTDEFKSRVAHGDVRWRLDFQFMQPGDDAQDPRKTWNGPWVPAGEIVVPQADANAAQLWDCAEQTRFNVWKNKTPDSTAVDARVLRPWGELNRARLAAYDESAGNRGCPLNAD